ncbi:fumarylacetoacetate hydrolase family protein [Umezawaea endophytica]|uniref:Fumarylacetoacetate hydrolase family protein n=1 Tax=Umezawaea endophytica TaxID=1654476 RepID=A0A9X2VFU5_9PSEU|nr:fumarylacetoacetate hydrolase family protein [Umezawaea endophytica]MCS7475885.1 fumarylacetoacetate hydrolase family protein [Umezawaea endophytica]
MFPSGQVFCAGANHREHTVEMSLVLLRGDPEETRPDAELVEEATAIADRVEAGDPYVFLGLPSALAGARDDVVLWGPGVQHDWEVEVAVVIGRTAHRVAPERALDHVAGYTICNDVSTRDLMVRPGFALSDFLMAKNRPTFFPIGPYLVPRRFVPDHRGLRMRLEVNGEVMQDGRVGDLVHGVEELVSYLSHATVLSPGDVVLTGTPAGNAGARGGRRLRPGDVVEATVTGLGHQRTLCVADPTAAGR